MADTQTADAQMGEQLPCCDSESEFMKERKRRAKYLFPGCGLPDGGHAGDCPSDTDAT
jgi:hypothetical protein